MFGLAVDHVDFMRRELRVDQQLWTPARDAPMLKTPKSRNSYRTIALSPLVLDTFAAHLEVLGPGEHGLRFHTDGRPAGRSMASKHIRLAVGAAGVEGHSWHELRHYHAAVLLSRRVSPALVEERLGHDVKTLPSTYSHVIRADEDRVRTIVDEALGGTAADLLWTEAG